MTDKSSAATMVAGNKRIKKQNDSNVAEIVNDTDGGNQVTKVTINFVFPFFCFYPWTSWFPSNGNQEK